MQQSKEFNPEQYAVDILQKVADYSHKQSDERARITALSLMEITKKIQVTLDYLKVQYGTELNKYEEILINKVTVALNNSDRKLKESTLFMLDAMEKNLPFGLNIKQTAKLKFVVLEKAITTHKEYKAENMELAQKVKDQAKVAGFLGIVLMIIVSFVVIKAALLLEGVV